MHVGDRKLQGKEDVNVLTIPPDPDNKFYVASDGLFEQIGKRNLPFGYNNLTDIILEHHSKSLDEISKLVWLAFNEHMSETEKRDDIELIAFKPKNV